MASPFSAMPGPLEAVTPIAPPKARRDLVLGLEGADPPALVHGQLFENAAGRRDGIGAEDEGDPGTLRGGEQPPGQRPVACHAAVEPRRHLGRLDTVMLGEHLGRLAEGVAGLEHAGVGFDEHRVLGEALLDRVERRVQGARVDPRHEPQGEEVLAPLLLLGIQRQVLERLLGHAADVDLVGPVLLAEPRVLERVLGIAGLVQVALIESRGVHDQDAARLEVGQMHFQRSRVHRHQRIELVSRRVDALAPELELEAGDTEQRPGGRPDLRREVGQRRNVIAGPGRLRGELLAGDLHAIARVPGEPDHGPRERATGLLGYPCGRYGLAHRSCILSLRLLTSFVS